MLNSREIATLVWICIAIVVLLLMPSVRGKVLEIARQALAPTLLPLWLTFFAWCSFWLWLGSLVRLWDLTYLKEAIITIATVGLPILFNSVGEKSAREITTHIGKRTLQLSVLVGFYLNLATLPLWAEIVGLPLLVFVATLAAVAGIDPKHAKVKSCLELLIGLGAVALFIWVTVQTVVTWHERDIGRTVLELLLSLWLPAVMFPFCYAAAYYDRCRTVVKGLRRYGDSPPFRVTLAALIGLNFSLRRANEFNGLHFRKVGKAGGFRAALREMSDFRDAADLERERREFAQAERVALIGVPGTDGTGAQLDRREYKVTKERLEWIWTTQMGRYASNGNRYWDDLTDWMVSAARHGLPSEHGFVTNVSPDGQRWRAWRRLPNGWVLGIGGAIPVHRQFHFAGPNPPATWPGDGPNEWREVGVDEWPRDWQKYDGDL